MAATTFLEAVNATLKLVGIIQGDSGALTTFTDTARQTDIDVMLQAWNDTLDELFKIGNYPGEQEENNITLSSGVGEYTLATDYTKIIGNPINSANRRIIYPSPWTFEQLRHRQPDPSIFTGRPLYWLINPTNNKMRFDKQATSEEDGDVYTYINEIRSNLSATGDTFPVSDEAVDRLKSAVAQVWSSTQKSQFNEGVYQASMSRAADVLARIKRRTKYGVRSSRLRPYGLSDAYSRRP